MNSLPSEIINIVALYVSTTEHWSMSRSCRYLYSVLNKKIYGLFKKRFEDEIEKRQDHYGFKIEDLLFFVNCQEYVFTGSLVWSTLLGEEWENQDIDIFGKKPAGRIGLHLASLNVFNQSINRMRNVTNTQLHFKYVNGAAYYDDLYSLSSSPGPHNVSVKILDIVMCVDQIKDKIENFDMIGCMSTFDDKWLTILKPHDTLFKRTGLADHYDVNKTPARILKYESRGVQVLIGHTSTET